MANNILIVNTIKHLRLKIKSIINYIIAIFS